MAFVNYNAWAEVVCTPLDYVYNMPDDMTFPEAAAFSMNFVAAYMMLFEVANLREGMSVLVHSAGGGVVSQLPKGGVKKNTASENDISDVTIDTDKVRISGGS